MKFSRRRVIATALVVAIISGAAWWPQRGTHHYLPETTDEFVAQFAAPAAADSAATRLELDELLTLERARTDAQVTAAREDRRTDIARFYAALGFESGHDPDLPILRHFAGNVESDIRPYVRAAKNKFRRLRPYEIEPRLHPCVGSVRGDLSYPSGHASYAYGMAYLLTDLVPERAAEIRKRADEFALQRMMCGVHFRSDLEAGKTGARWLHDAFIASPDYLHDSRAAAAEVRAALKLGPLAP